MITILFMKKFSIDKNYRGIKLIEKCNERMLQEHVGYHLTSL